MPENEAHTLGGYALKEVIGHGGLGTVYLATDEASGKQVAVKLLPATAALTSEYSDRFYTEARLATQIDHPNIIRVFDYGRDEGHLYLVMEYVDGPSCRARIGKRGKLPWREAVDIARQVARGLAAGAEQGIIHRDVKPDNILIDSNGRARLADLGLAKDEDTIQPLPSDTSLGTPDYMSPEQVANSEEVDFRTDVYALGATLFHMVCGKAPYTGRSAYAVMVQHVTARLPSPLKYTPDLPRDVVSVMRKMMARDPDGRYQSYRALIADLDALLADEPIEAAEFHDESMLANNGNGEARAGLLSRLKQVLWPSSAG
ncbi:MAG: serine/threonine-protein kinase [Planctomycetota bacterium]